ncbi:MAG: hypothetical protein ACE5J9_00575 [Methanosarcinales archaeon]
MTVQEIIIKLVKPLSYKQIFCTCGSAVFSVDPSPEITKRVKDLAKKYRAKFMLIDPKVNPEVMVEHNITDLPVILINNKLYTLKENFEDMIRNILKNGD